VELVWFLQDDLLWRSTGRRWLSSAMLHGAVW